MGADHTEPARRGGRNDCARPARLSRPVPLLAEVARSSRRWLRPSSRPRTGWPRPRPKPIRCEPTPAARNRRSSEAPWRPGPLSTPRPSRRLAPPPRHAARNASRRHAGKRNGSHGRRLHGIPASSRRPSGGSAAHWSRHTRRRCRDGRRRRGRHDPGTGARPPPGAGAGEPARRLASITEFPAAVAERGSHAVRKMRPGPGSHPPRRSTRSAVPCCGTCGSSPGIDQLTRGLHHVTQHRVQAVSPCHRQERAQQTPQPALRALHVPRPQHQLLEKIVQLQPGDLGKRHIPAGDLIARRGAGVAFVVGRGVTHDGHRPDHRHRRRRVALSLTGRPPAGPPPSRELASRSPGSGATLHGTACARGRARSGRRNLRPRTVAAGGRLPRPTPAGDFPGALADLHSLKR